MKKFGWNIIDDFSGSLHLQVAGCGFSPWPMKQKMHSLCSLGLRGKSQNGCFKFHCYFAVPFPDFEYARAAFMKEANRGWDVRGLDLNSG